MIELKYRTLINELDDIVDSKHINQVKKVIEDLTKINSFKIELLHTLDIDVVYKKISHFLSTNFHIMNYRVMQKIHNIEEVKFISEDKKEKYPYTFLHSINEIGDIEISLDNTHLEIFEQVYFRTVNEGCGE
jgi:hypothetical protein